MRLFLLAAVIVWSVSCHSLRGPLKESSVTQIAQPIHFDFDSSVLGPDAERRLEQKVRLLDRNRWVHLTLEGHTDRVGPADYNRMLGDLRARAVLVALVRRGVEPRRLAIVSFGEQRPVSAGRSPADHARDRRVEFRVR